MTPIMITISIFSFFALITPLVSTLSTDGIVLLSLLKGLTVPSSILSSWNSSDSNPCQWLGIECDSNHNVITLNMSSNQIFGRLGKEIGQLEYLENIDLNNNSISGMISSVLGNCTRLVNIDLAINFFTGELPSNFKNFQRLKSLVLYENLLSGTIPESLFMIPNMEAVLLQSNRFTGSIPSNLGNMTKLKSLWLDHNMFSGLIPNSIVNCTKLEGLYVNDNQLIGNLPVALNKLESLVDLDVSSNGLDGNILFGSHSCKNLTSLVLSFNRFRGQIPDLGNCTSLSVFIAVNNSLTGTIPSSLGLLSELSLLYLSGNPLSGNIPPEIGNCSSLTDLQLYENQLEGAIPSELGMLHNLQILLLYSNKLSGEFPPVLWTIPTLQNVSVYRNNLSGVLPLEISEVHKLGTLLLYDNQFSGDIPQGLGINSSLENLDFTSNKFTGEFPKNLCFGKQLRFLNLGSNQLQGNIPSDIGNCTTLQRLRLGNNSLTGPLPEFAENSSLSFMDIRQNRINGAIPSSLMNCANLSSLYLSKNELTGSIPENLGNLVKLQALNLSSNNLQGPLPPQISKCVDLFSLDVSFNSLNGSIPVNLRNLTRLDYLILGQNKFTGEIPDIFPELTTLSELQLGGNMLGGEIPPSLGQLQNLAYALNLSNNNLTGRILELERLTMVQRLDISQNNLTGSLAPLDKLTSLVEMNVSYNHFEGRIPDTLLKFLNSSSSSFSGNQGLCFPCQSRGGLNCNDDNGLSPCEQLSSQPKRGISTAIIVIIAVGSLVLFVIVLSLLGCYFLRFRRSESHVDDTVALVGSSIDLRDVMIATEELNERFIIGRGAHGVVYKVALDSDKVYALKKLDFESSRGASASMVKEIQIVGQIRHRNLVKVKDFWFKKDYGLILYKYMPSGSLHDVLYEISPTSIIAWDVRYKIALGIAQGLEYLHHDCDPIIVHRDIKPKNILLDSEMEPRISDFGIAKLIDHRSSSSMGTVTVVGTTGYLAPETAYTTVWRKESDVYSYGVVLLELITRKQAMDSSFEEGIDIVNWAGPTWNITKSMDRIIDPSLMEIMNPTDKEEVLEIFFLALRCTAKQPNERPTMRDAVKRITDIKTKAGSSKSGV